MLHARESVPLHARNGPVWKLWGYVPELGELLGELWESFGESFWESFGRSFFGGEHHPAIHSRPCRPHSHVAGGGVGEAQMGATRAVVGVSRLESLDPCRFARFMVEVDTGGAAVTGDLVAEFSAEVVYPRLLIDKCLAVQADELVLVVFYTTGVHKQRAGEAKEKKA